MSVEAYRVPTTNLDYRRLPSYAGYEIAFFNDDLETDERKLEVGREVCVWRPWSTIDLPPGTNSGLDLGGASVWTFTRYYPPPSHPAPPA